MNNANLQVFLNSLNKKELQSIANASSGVIREIAEFLFCGNKLAAFAKQDQHRITIMKRLDPLLGREIAKLNIRLDWMAADTLKILNHTK
ncbi:hypothetical protein [Iodobacter sp.]|uniref:hypothetical protein n=1 Tax=Iodobacter sp. TaxID=1915058 RepID=UPI0025CDC3F4|nr:hypothetical protein [Iodobacter sp.]